MAIFVAVFAFSFVQNIVLADTPLSPGGVRTTKTATAVDGKLNTWDINLKIEARDLPKTSDTVIVIDNSGSMTLQSSQKLAKAKAAAKSLVTKLSASSLNKMALVTFDSDVQNVYPTTPSFTGDATTLNNKIDGITTRSSSNYYTNTQLGLNRAEQYIKASTAAIKTIIFLSDGDPTRSAGVGSSDNNNAICSNFSTYVTSGNTNTNIPSTLYNYGRVVGSDATIYSDQTTCSSNSNNRYRYNHDNSARAEVGFAKIASTYSHGVVPTIYTIGLEVANDSPGDKLMKFMATSPAYAKSGSASDLDSIFNDIAGNILSAAKNVSISDTVADKFDIVSYTTGGVKTGQTVKWSNVSLGDPNSDGVRTGYVTIRIQLKSGDSGANATTVATDTNSAVQFEYDDTNGTHVIKNGTPGNANYDNNLKSPKVHPVHVHVQLVIDGVKADPSDSFNVSVANGSANYGNNFGSVAGDSTTDYSPDRPLETGNYTISQTITGGGLYDTTYQYKIGDGSWKTATSITEITAAYQADADANPTKNNDLYVKVTNKAKTGTLTISKSLADCNPGVGKTFPVQTFKFEVKNSAGTVVATPELTVKNTTDCPATINVTLPQGTYTVTELGATDYTTTPGKVQTVTIGLAGVNSLSKTVSFKNVFNGKTIVTAQKIWVGGVNGDHKTTFTVTRNDGMVVVTESVNGDKSFSWELPAGDQYGNPYTYTVSEAPIANYTMTRDGNVFTNTYKSPNIDVVATKNWVNGPSTHPDVEFELYRKVGTSGAEVKVANSKKTVSSGTSNSKTVTWTGMPKYDDSGVEYIYLVHEVAVPTNYTKNENGLTVTNTYKIPTGPVSATKIWTGGANATKPTVYFKLYRQIGSATPEVASAELKQINGTTTTAQWLGVQLTDNNGNEYTFSVKEVNADGTPFVSVNYTVSESGLTVTNTYKSTDRTITVNKTWVGGKTSDHVASFTLYRDGVAVSGSTKTITGNNSASWTVPVTDDQGNVYTYTVGEAAVANYESSCGFLAILCAVNNDGVANITNTYKIPTNGVFAATKVWDGGPLANTPVQIQLYQGSNAYGTPVTTVNNIASWTNLPETDSNGNKLSYSVKEVTGLPNYTSIVSNETPVSATITNKYESPKIPVVANKTWVNGDSQNRPEIYFQLYRKIAGGIDQVVGTAQKVVNNQVNFGQQDKTDVTGKEYTYFVKEVNASGVNVAPANYTKNEDGLTVTNTYVAPQNGTFTATKVWEGGARAGEEVQIQLMQNGVDFRAAQTTSSLTTSWSNLPVTDDSGVAYVYTVREVSDFSADHYEAPFVTYNGNSATIKNKFTSPKIDVNVTKIWVGGADRPAVTVQLKRTAGNTTENVSTKTITSPATTAVWEDEPQFNGAGIEYVYSVIETNVPTNYTVSYGTDANGLTVTNTYGSPKTQFTATKVWVDGPAVHPTIELQLMRDGADFGSKVSLTNGTTTYTWTGLDQTDPNGKVYSYTVKEITVFEDYTMSQTGNTITNTYKSLPRTISASKVWDGGLVSTHVTRFTLNGGPADMTGRTQSVTGDATVTWSVPANDNNGAPYTYTVSEEKVASYDADCDTNCVLDENGNVTITNTYKSPKTEVTALKHWVNGPTDRPDVKLQLVRNGADVTGEIATLTSATGWSYTWSNLDKTGHDGVDYTYTVRELDLGPKYDATYSDNKLEVTNTYVIPKDGEATATKTWVNGGSLTRPTVYFQLYRAISGGAAEVVPGAAIKELVNGTTQATWTELETTDINGNPYTFSVKEVDANGSDATPDTYSKVEEGLNVTNTYTSPKTTFTAKKIWNGGPSARPTIQIQLYQNGVALGAPITLVNGVTEFTWNDLDLTDKDGVTYEYAVDEIGVPSDYKLIGINRTENGAELTNNYIGTPGMGGGKPPVELPKTGIDASSNSPLIILLAGILTYGVVALVRSYGYRLQS